MVVSPSDPICRHSHRPRMLALLMGVGPATLAVACRASHMADNDAAAPHITAHVIANLIASILSPALCECLGRRQSRIRR
jgi:hypothetical protein